MIDIPFEVGALYHRRNQIHGLLGGQRQGGISTPSDAPFVIAFTGEAGKSHGYADFWDDDGVFHYFGEGQEGDMQLKGGHRAIDQHQVDGKRLLLFQMMGHGKPCRYLGEFVRLSTYVRPDTPATRGGNRNALVFRLAPKDDRAAYLGADIQDAGAATQSLDSTVATQLVSVRKKQSLFRRRLLGVEKQCRLTGVQDLRFLRASHIKPWSACATGDERTDGHNGLLLTPHADALFDRGWITFEDKGRLVTSAELPVDVVKRIGLNLRSGRTCGDFTPQQHAYLEFHRNAVFEKAYQSKANPLTDLLEEVESISSPGY